MGGLTITDIRPFWCGRFPFLKVYTSEGVTGIGESVVDHPAIQAGQIGYLKEMLIGEDPRRVERLWAKMHSAVRFAHANSMISAVDMALWDIKARYLGVPAYELLGGLTRECVRVYPHLRGTWNSFPDERTNGIYSEPWGTKGLRPQEAADRARELVRQGYTAMKFDPFGPGRDGYHAYRPSEIDAAVEIVGAIREAVGSAVDLMVECHGKFNAATAIKIGKELESFQLMWLEEPVPAELPQAVKKVVDHVHVPIALGERLDGKRSMKQYLESGVVDVMMFDLGKIGGLTEALKVCALCETYQVKASPHNPFGPITAVASAHLSAAAPSFIIQEHEEMAPWAVQPSIQVENGYIRVGQRPGFGVELDEEAIAENQRRVEEGEFRAPAWDAEIFAPA